MASFSAGLNTGRDNVEERLPPLEHLSIANESLINQVASAKQELKHHYQRYQRMLNDKHQQMVSQLDAILLSANDLYKKKKELIQAQGELKKVIRRNEFHDMKARMLDPLLVELSELERSISRSEREVVELAWKDSQLEAAIKASCVVLQRDPVVVSSTTPAANTCISYKDRQVPVWSVGSVGTGDGQMNEPKGLAIDPENGDIYVADRDNNRIVIFNKDGKFQRNMKIYKLDKPWTVLITGEFVYVSCTISNEGLIVKANKINGNILASFKPGNNMLALTLDKKKGLLLGCPLHVATIWYIQQDNLNKISEVKLQTTNFTQGTTQIYAIETRREEIFILFRKSPYPLQSFSRDGKLLRNMIIPADKIEKAYFFTIDSQANFIISDNSVNKVNIFAHTGELIAVIGKVMTEERAQGELYGPCGIELTRNGNIVVCDGKSKYKLQMF